MDYVRVDWSNGDYSYFKNDTLAREGNYRNAFLMHNNFLYKRIKRIKNLPVGKECTRYKRHNKASQDWEVVKGE